MKGKTDVVRGGVPDLGASHSDLLYLKQLWKNIEVGDDSNVVNLLVWSRVRVQVLHDSFKIYTFYICRSKRNYVSWPWVAINKCDLI